MLKPIRIAFISPIFYSGGIPRTFLAIAEGLNGRGYEFYMINSFVDEFQERFTKCGKCVYIPDNVKIIKYLQENNIDIVQTNNFPRGNQIAHLAGVPRIVERLSGTYWAFQFDKSPVDCVIASTDNGYKKAYSDYPHKYVTKIYNGVDLSIVYPHKKDKDLIRILGIQQNEIIIGYCGRIALEKCLDKLVDVFARVIETEQNVKLVLLGTTFKGCIEPLKEQIKKINLSNHISFIESSDDPEKVINLFDIGVITSGKHKTFDGEIRITTEGLSNSIMEQMAMELPIVATNSGETSSLVQDGHNGYVVDTEDMDSFYHRLMELIKNKSLCHEMGQNGRKIIEERFNRQDMIDRYDNLYKYVLTDEFAKKYPTARQKMEKHYLGSRFEFNDKYEEPKNILVFRSGSKQITDNIINDIEQRFSKPNTVLLCHKKSFSDIDGYKNIKDKFVYDRSDSFDSNKMQDIVDEINQLNLDYFLFIFNDLMALDENQNVVDLVNSIKAKKKILVSKGNMKFLWPR